MRRLTIPGKPTYHIDANEARFREDEYDTLASQACGNPGGGPPRTESQLADSCTGVHPGVACTLAWRHVRNAIGKQDVHAGQVHVGRITGIDLLACPLRARLLQSGPKAGDVRKGGLCSLRVVRPSGPHYSEEEKATGSAEPSGGASLIVVARQQGWQGVQSQ